MQVTIKTGDAREQLRSLDDASIQCCVTSPPYWGLRDYGHPGQLGAEATPEEFTANLVEVFREVRRVIKDDGTLWLNLGDSYSSTTGGQTVIKPKDLIGIPWRVAFALQVDGWHLRQDIIWHKPSPMPESVTDRCTKAHEYIFLMSKSEKYKCNMGAIRETAETPIDTNSAQSFKAKGGKARQNYGTNEDLWSPTGTRNKRSVWTMQTLPFKGAHFATFPAKLAELCILAGSDPGDEILDPFGGSGTTGATALGLGRSSTLIELNPDYVELMRGRCNVTPGLGI